jgi:hypothetical protein
VEAENEKGQSICGKWVHDGDKWYLEFPKLYGLISYCVEHDTYPAKGEPCWQCANPHIISADLSAARQGFDRGYTKGTKFVDELEAQIANLVIDKTALTGIETVLAQEVERLNDNVAALERVLYEVSKGNVIPPWFRIEHDDCAGRCKVHQRLRHPYGCQADSPVYAPDPEHDEFVFTKAEIMGAIKKLWMKS